MRISDYADSLKHSILSAPFVISHSLEYEERLPIAGLVRGAIGFADGSQLLFKEFLHITVTAIRLKYSYHCEAATGNLVFRYDNPRDPQAKALPSYPDHKHIANGLRVFSRLTLAEVLKEVATHIKVT